MDAIAKGAGKTHILEVEMEHRGMGSDDGYDCRKHALPGVEMAQRDRVR
jgi:hypothetical protein